MPPKKWRRIKVQDSSEDERDDDNDDKMKQKVITIEDDDDDNPVPSSSGSGIPQPQQSHPLLIPRVIQTIISNLCGPGIEKDIQDFRNIRLVNKIWNQEGSRMYRASCGKGKELLFGTITPTRFRRFLKDTKNTVDSPFSKFRFRPMFFNHPEDNGTDESWYLKKFLRQHFQWLNVLKFEINNEANLDNLGTKGFEDLRFEGLSELSFRCWTKSGLVENSRHNIELTYLLQILLRGAGNLKKLTFEYPSVPRHSGKQHLVSQRLSEILASNCPKSVERLGLKAKLTKVQLQTLLIDLKLELKILIFDFRQSEVDYKDLEDFLNQQKDTLEELRFTDSERPELKMELKFPILTKLTRFRIQQRIKPFQSGFQYANNFPVLERLELHGKQRIFENWLGTWKTASRTVRHVGLYLTVDDIKMFPVIKDHFLYLNSLHIHVDERGDEIVRYVFGKLNNDLEELEITFDYNPFERSRSLDPLFTGLPKWECKRLRNHVNKINSKDPETLGMMRPYTMMKMKKLRRLVIRGEKARVTKVTVHFAFMKLDNLKEIQIRRFPINRDLLDKLRRRMEIIPDPDSVYDSDPDSDISSDDCTTPEGSDAEDDY